MTGKIMEGITGTYSAMRLRETPVKGFENALIRNDEKGMERSMDFAVKMNGRAVEYQKITSNGLKEESEELKKLQAQQQEKLSESVKAGNAQAVKASAKDQGQESAAKAGALTKPRFDHVEISKEGRNWISGKKAANSRMIRSEKKEAANGVNAQAGIRSTEGRTQQASSGLSTVGAGARTASVKPGTAAKTTMAAAMPKAQAMSSAPLSRGNQMASALSALYK